MTRAINIWRLSDRRAGHDNQSLGLVDALSRLHPLNAITIEVNGARHGAQQVLARRGAQPPPALIVGAGHATHAALVIGAWQQHARSIVLMSPSLPIALFDLCIVPEHDGVRPRPNVLQSVGALNRIQASAQRDPKLALILLGGPSRHHVWEQDALFAQIRELVNARTTLQWLIASSPRTPAQTMQALAALEHVQLVRFEDTSADWLSQKLARASLVWVSEDSMSMAYEALTSGAPTGLLHVDLRDHDRSEDADKGHARNRPNNRIAAAIRALRDSGRIISTKQWLDGQQPQIINAPLREADRCAQQILQRWPDLR